MTQMKKTLQVVMLPTNEKSKLVLSYCKELAINWTHDLAKFDDATYQHLYFLSDEEIKEGDWYLTFQNNEVIGEPRKCEDSSYSFIYCKKIIATTDKLRIGPFMGFDTETGVDCSDFIPQPTQSFIEHFVEEYNKGNVITEVEVEYEEIVVYKQRLNEGFGSYYHKVESEFVLKINPDNTINILPKKDSWSREEVIEFARRYAKRCQAPMTDNKWLEENLYNL